MAEQELEQLVNEWAFVSHSSARRCILALSGFLADVPLGGWVRIRYRSDRALVDFKSGFPGSFDFIAVG
ncbi:MAG: hypothetical protein KME30_13540 [Iphinoe sp. HA4291-MV1]|jgi:hypothetical protein|nr:hypothetical protein [Iphinoe sp. HA4291-MV1]